MPYNRKPIIIGLLTFVMIFGVGGLLVKLVKDLTKLKTQATINKSGDKEFITYIYKEQTYEVNIKDNEKFKKYENGDKLKIHVDEDDPNKFRLATSIGMDIFLISLLVLILVGSGIILKNYIRKRGKR